MASDPLVEYADLLNQLKVLLGAPDFEQVFANLTSDLPKPKQFLLKMELKRLAQPCNYYVDLRGLVDGKVEAYDYQGRTFYFDEVASNVFEKGLKRYGKFNIALYEELQNTENSFKVMQKRADESEKRRQELGIPADDDANAAKIVRFTSYAIRNEERMNFSIPLEVTAGGKTFPATSTDISVSGSKIKVLKRYRLAPEQIIHVQLTGLERDFTLGLKQGIEYQVVAVEPSADNYSYVRLKRTYAEDIANFDEFLKNFINGNKRRYKVNLENTLDAVIIKGYEQYYLPRVGTLPVYLSEDHGIFTPKAVLTTENSRDVVSYFRDENQALVLHQILNNRRLKTWQQLGKPQYQTLMYCFTHTAGGKVYFYSATLAELNEVPALKALFFGFASQRESFRVFNVQLLPASAEDAVIPLSLPNTTDEEVKRLNKPPNARVLGVINPIRYLVTFTDVSQGHMTQCYQRVEFDQSLVNKLKVFGHPKLDSYPQIEVTPLEYINLRGEARYLYRSDIRFESEDGQWFEGHTRDFSVSGMQVELTAPCHLQKGQKVKLSLPDFQKITKKYSLQELPYEVMAVSKSLTIVNLRAVQNVENHQGKAFFAHLVDNNKDRLTIAAESPKFPRLSEALRNIYTRGLWQMSMYLHRFGTRYQLDVVGTGRYPMRLVQLLQRYRSNPEKVDLKGLFQRDELTTVIIAALKKMKRQDKPYAFDLMLLVDPEQRAQAKAITTLVVTPQHNSAEIQAKVRKAASDKLVLCFRIWFSRTGRPDIDYLAKELNYVSVYAIHRAKELEEELWNVVAVGDVQDITEAYFEAWQLDSGQLAKQQALRGKFSLA